MSRLYKNDSPIEIALQEVEALMQKHGLKLTCMGTISVIHSPTNSEGVLKDTESRQHSMDFPRQFDSERIFLYE